MFLMHIITTTSNHLTTKLSLETMDAIIQKVKLNRRLVMLPYPLQGHINPMFQLANILHSKGFSITILHTRFNAPDPTNHPHLDFLQIPGVAEENLSSSGINNLIHLMHYFNNNCLEPVQDCLEQLLLEEGGVACLITDAQWIMIQQVADRVNIPRIVYYTSSVSSILSFSAVPLLRQMGYLRPPSNEEMKSEELVPGLEPLKVKDISKFLTSDPEGAGELMGLIAQGMKPAQAIIWNTFKELEELQLLKLTRDFTDKHFMIGPFHKYFPRLSSSLLTEDMTSISWLDKHAPNSVLYVSFGSLAGVDESEFLEIAWGLANSKQPFLWVVRPGSVKGSEWLEALPDGYLEKVVEGRGHIVKWAPQEEVLAHHATGGFWTHNGWNSTLESICEGVPMLCSPSFGDQLTISRNVTDDWKIGVELGNGFERGEIESAIKTLMVDKKGLEIRDRIMSLKEKARLCLKKGCSSYSSLEDLANYILSS